VFEQNGYPDYVLYCRWEDRSSQDISVGEESSRAARVRSVWTGRGNGGQRVLEVAIRGVLDQQEAEAALVRELEKLIKVAK
jgi:hypothetical protein